MNAPTDAAASLLYFAVICALAATALNRRVLEVENQMLAAPAAPPQNAESASTGVPPDDDAALMNMMPDPEDGSAVQEM